MNSKNAYLILADGTIFTGKQFGAEGPAEGELVFTTAMTGYQETLTDPGYTGQIVCQTFPAMGNYGLNSEDSESGRVWPTGYVVREWCEHPSNFRCETDLDAYLKKHRVPGIYGIDTRALTRRLRREGTINAMLLSEVPEDTDKTLDHIKGITPLKGAVRRVSRGAVQVYPAGNARHRVVMYDYGAKEAIIRALNERGIEVVAVPCDFPADEAAALCPDGFMLSNGPGDPADAPELADIVKEIVAFGKPIFGICLGHQILARAMGAKTHKLPFGHRGENQPVIDLALGRTFITSQSHGYAVIGDSVTGGEVSHRNANDGSVEGIRYPAHNAFSVQFHPEACAGPQDTGFLFDRFEEMLSANKNR